MTISNGIVTLHTLPQPNNLVKPKVLLQLVFNALSIQGRVAAGVQQTLLCADESPAQQDKGFLMLLIELSTPALRLSYLLVPYEGIQLGRKESWFVHKGKHTAGRSLGGQGCSTQANCSKPLALDFNHPLQNVSTVWHPGACVRAQKKRQTDRWLADRTFQKHQIRL